MITLISLDGTLLGLVTVLPTLLELAGTDEACVNIQEDSTMERVNNIAFKLLGCMESLGGVISCTLSIIVVNRSPGSSMNRSTTTLFFDEFSTMLERLV